MLSARIAMLNGAPVIIVFNYLILDIGWEVKKTMCVYFGNHAVWRRVVCYCSYIHLMFLLENSWFTLGTKARLNPLVSWWCIWLLNANASWLKYAGSCLFTSLNRNLSSWHLYISYDFRRCNCLKIGSEWARKLLDVMIRIAFFGVCEVYHLHYAEPPITEYHSLSDKG